jgi:hypothetical protein
MRILQNGKRIRPFLVAALVAAGLSGCSTDSPPAYYGGGPTYYSRTPEYVPYYAGRPVERNYYYGGRSTEESHNDNWFHRGANGVWRNSEGETPRQERREQNR